MNDTDLAYIAGLFDGEACIRVKKTQAYKCQDRQTPGYHAAVHIHMVDEEAIKFVAETLGGWYYREKPHSAQGRPLYRWSASDAAAERILRLLLPYLRVKRASAENVLRLREIRPRSERERGHSFPPCPSVTARELSHSRSDEGIARIRSVSSL